MRTQALISFLALAIISMTAGRADADYQAEVFFGAMDGPIAGRIFVTADGYRLAPSNKAGPTHLLVENKSGRTTILDTERKTYSRVDTHSRKILDINPIEVFRLTAGFYAPQNAGRETINGVACEKISFLNNSRPLISAWISDKYRLPIKVVNHVFPQMNFEMKNIQEGQIDPARMHPPSDYTPMAGASEMQLRSAPEDLAKEWIIKAETKQKISFAQNQGLKLKISDDGADGLQSKGLIVFYRRAEPPLDRYSAPFRLPNGRSQTMQYPASALISAIEFQVTQGSVRVQRIGPK